MTDTMVWFVILFWSTLLPWALLLCKYVFIIYKEQGMRRAFIMTSSMWDYTTIRLQIQ